MAASSGGFVWLTEEAKSTGRGSRLSLASWTLLILSTSSAGQQRAGCPHTTKALSPRADAAPPNGTVTRSCVTAPNESRPRLHSSSRRQLAGCGGGGEGNGGRGLKFERVKQTRVSSLSSQRPISLNSGSGLLDSAFDRHMNTWPVRWGSARASFPHCCAWRLQWWPFLWRDLLPCSCCLFLFCTVWSFSCICICSLCWNSLWPWPKLWEGTRSELVLISSLLLACPRSIPQGHSSTSTLHSSTWKPNCNVTWEKWRKKMLIHLLIIRMYVLLVLPQILPTFKGFANIKMLKNVVWILLELKEVLPSDFKVFMP